MNVVFEIVAGLFSVALDAFNALTAGRPRRRAQRGHRPVPLTGTEPPRDQPEP